MTPQIEALPGMTPLGFKAQPEKQVSSHALGAKNIKKELAKAFPNIKFSVRSSSYSGGDSIDVHWDMGPTSKEVDAIIGKYQEGSFDGMNDLYTYDSDRAFTKANGGAKYVHSHRGYDQALYEQLGRDLCKLQRVEFTGQYTRNLLGQGDTRSLNEHVNILLYATSFKANEVYAGVRYRNDDERNDAHMNQWAVMEKKLKS